MGSDDLKAWRKVRGIGQAELARLLGVSVGTVWRWERGDRTMPGELLRLALVGLDTERQSPDTKKPSAGGA